MSVSKSTPVFVRNFFVCIIVRHVIFTTLQFFFFFVRSLFFALSICAYAVCWDCTLCGCNLTIFTIQIRFGIGSFFERQIDRWRACAFYLIHCTFPCVIFRFNIGCTKPLAHKSSHCITIQILFAYSSHCSHCAVQLSNFLRCFFFSCYFR